MLHALIYTSACGNLHCTCYMHKRKWSVCVNNFFQDKLPKFTKEYRAITYYWDEDTWEIEKVNKQEIIPSEIYSRILTHNEHKEFIATRIIFGCFVP